MRRPASPSGVLNGIFISRPVSNRPIIYRVMRIFIRTIVFTAVMAAPLAYAETAYVIDRLLVPIHAEQSLDSEIAKVVPTGTPLEVMKRTTEWAQVRALDGTTGWIDAAYLMAELPAQRIASDLASENDSLKTRIAELEQAAVTHVGDEPAGLPDLVRPGILLWLIGISVVLLAIAFAGGAYLMDCLQRRRHGGFRI